MKQRAVCCVFLLLFLQALGQTCGDQVCSVGENCIRDCHLESIRQVLPLAGRVDWSHGGKQLIAFDRKGKDGYYDLFVMNPDGSGERCITCGNAQVPQKNNGQPTWHSSGDWIVFQSEKAVHEGKSRFASPGLGVFNDLWAASADGMRFYPLTDLPPTGNYGVLHPHFSHDGKQLSWTEMYKKAAFNRKGTMFGHWKIKIADFSVDSSGTPKLSNVREFIPGDSVFYENHGFSPDGNYLLFCSNMKVNVSCLTGNNIYKMEIATGKLTQLTFERYNEHASFSPDGKRIIWGTNKDNRRGGMDYWIMNADGSDKQRVTYFNKRGYPESRRKALAVDMSWNPDGRAVVSYVQMNVRKQKGTVWMIRFKDTFVK